MWKMLTVLLLVLFITCGCMTHRALQTQQLTDFKKNIRSEHKEISDLKIQMSPTRIEFYYYLNRKTNRDADKDIFLKTKELISSGEFQKTSIETYLNLYSKDVRGYPDIIVRFYGNRKDKADYEYSSSYYGPGVKGAEDRPIDGYKTWFFDDYSSLSVPVAP